MEAFCGSILFFIAGHELALVSECGKKLHCLPAMQWKWLCGWGLVGERWGAYTGWLAVACGMDCEYWFLLVLRDSLPVEL